LAGIPSASVAFFMLILFNESDKIINDQKEVANHFNNFFSTVAENIGKDTVYNPSDHPSLKVLLALSLIYPEKHSDLLTYLKYL
jgi:hypothetical protein